MSKDLINNIHDIDLEYQIVVKKAEDILFEVTDNSNERLVYESIINGIEKYAAQTIKDGKVAQLPFIGCIRKNPIRKLIQDNHEAFSAARKQMTLVEYKDHVRTFVNNAKKEQDEIERYNNLVKKVRSINKKKYDKLYINIGKAYAEMFINSILWLREVPFDVNVQTQYDLLNGL